VLVAKSGALTRPLNFYIVLNAPDPVLRRATLGRRSQPHESCRTQLPGEFPRCHKRHGSGLSARFLTHRYCDVPMKGADPISAKWDHWLAQLTQEVLTLFFYRKLWRMLIGAAEAAQVPGSFMFTFLAESYATRQAVAIRRLCKARSGQYSFRNLLAEIRDHPKLTANSTDPQEIEADIQSLNAGKLWRVHTYVDQYVAHKQEPPIAVTATYEDIDAAIDLLGELLQKYLLLVHNERVMLDTVIAGDVMAPFRMAWLPSLPDRPQLRRP
jgi:hypothetical protein